MNPKTTSKIKKIIALSIFLYKGYKLYKNIKKKDKPVVKNK